MTAKTLTQLIPQATFKLPVLVPVPGAEPVEARFEFKARKKTEYEQFLKAAEKMSDEEVFSALVVGWEFEEEFTPENVKILLEGSHQVAASVATAYMREYQRVLSGS
jgi:hypothetical protein